jgi:hypothetical protein
MQKIKVLSPIRLRVRTGAPARDFTPGVHEVSEEEFGHWFMQACIKEGRAVLVTEESALPEKTAELDEADLKKLNNADLKAMLQELDPGVEIPENMTKANLVAAILKSLDDKNAKGGAGGDD